MLHSIIRVKEMLLGELKASTAWAQAAHERKVGQCRQLHRDEVMQLQLRHEARVRELEEHLAEARAQANQATVAHEAALVAIADLESQVPGGRPVPILPIPPLSSLLRLGSSGPPAVPHPSVNRVSADGDGGRQARAAVRARVCEAEVEFEGRLGELQRDAERLRQEHARAQAEALMERSVAEAAWHRRLEDAEAAYRRWAAKAESDHAVQVRGPRRRRRSGPARGLRGAPPSQVGKGAV